METGWDIGGNGNEHRDSESVGVTANPPSPPLMWEMTTRSALTRTSSVLSRGMVTARTITGPDDPPRFRRGGGEEQGGPRPRAETTARPSSPGRKAPP